jgi:hypothetical protein
MMTGVSRSSSTSVTRAPPRASNSSSAAGERFQALTVQPALRRFAAIGAPIRPRPTKPASFRSLSMLPHFVVANLHRAYFAKLFNILASIQYDEHYDD